MYRYIYVHVHIHICTYKEGWALKNWCFWFAVLEKTLESPLDNKEIKPINPKGNQWKNQCWSRSSNTLANWCEELTHWKRLWGWERLKAKGEGGNIRQHVGWHHWLNGHEFVQTLESWWWTGKPGILQSLGSQRVRHNLETKQQQCILHICACMCVHTL